MFHKIAATYPKLLKPGNLGFGLWIGYVFTWGIAILLLHMFQQLLMAKDPRTIGRSAAALSILSGWIQTVPVFLLGIACTILIPGLKGKATDVATVLFASKFLNPWVGAAIIAAAFAAGVSTLDSQLLTASSILVRDLYVNPLGKKLPPEEGDTAKQIHSLRPRCHNSDSSISKTRTDSTNINSWNCCLYFKPPLPTNRSYTVEEAW